MFFGKDSQMETLRFETGLQRVKVILITNGNEEECYLQELSGLERQVYNDSFNFNVDIVEGVAKATPGSEFKMMSPSEFLAMTLHHKDDTLFDAISVGKMANRVVDKLYQAGLALSGLDRASMEAAKNALLGENTDSGSESQATSTEQSEKLKKP